VARVFGKGLPGVLKENIMDKIGASNEWKWQGYGPTSTVEINGKPIESVSGGTRWDGGLWINSQDLARFGLLILNKGNWDGKQVVSDKWIQHATTPSVHGARLRISVVAEPQNRSTGRAVRRRASPPSAMEVTSSGSIPITTLCWCGTGSIRARRWTA